MGIPSYFSYIIKNHSCIVRKLSNFKDGVDNLYLDSNSIVYDTMYSLMNELHAKTDTELNKMTKDVFEMLLIEGICAKIEEYISNTQPRDSVIIAFDGVAPVAKLEQQRIRRYKSAFQKDIMKNFQKKQTKFEWEQSAITPGTEFMNKMGSMIKQHFSKRNDINIRVSDSDECGEGEHKIFEHIRNNKEAHQNKVTLIYGLDADLIMLSLNHLPIVKGIYLYRETPHFIKHINSDLVPNEHYVFNIPELADNIVDSMNSGRKTEQQKNNVIYDYIFLSFLLGNDFMPHFPSVNIRTSGIDILLNTYRATIGNKNKYLTNGKVIYWGNVRKLFEVLAEEEWKNLSNEYKIRRRWQKRTITVVTDDDLLNKFNAIPIQNREVEECINPFEAGWEHRYYKHLFDVDITRELKKHICINYLECIEWTSKYYTSHCYDWRWHYKYDYAPLISDLLEYIPCFEMEFIEDKGINPVTPLVQLSYVLPRKTLTLLPNEVREKILQKYDEWYQFDYDFKWAFCKYFWESHVTMPCIDIKKLEEVAVL